MDDFDKLQRDFRALKTTDDSPLAESIRENFYRMMRIYVKRGEAKGWVHPNYDPMPNFWSTWASVQTRD